jgi:hypothetical protein
MRPIEHPIADVLRVLAVSRSSGALEIRGVRGGTFFLTGGDITYAEALGVPPAEELDDADPRLPSMIRSSIVEAALSLLGGETVDSERPLFRPGRRHWSGRACQVAVEALLSEIAVLMDDFDRLGINPDDQVQLRELPRGRTVVLSRRQWGLAAELIFPQTARSLAWRSGTPLGLTIETVATLLVAGVVERGEPVAKPVPSSVRRTEQPVEETPSRRPVRRRGSEGKLPNRVPGATSVPPVAPVPAVAPRSGPPRSSQWNEPDGRAVALRLLEGLRRL